MLIFLEKIKHRTSPLAKVGRNSIGQFNFLTATLKKGVIMFSYVKHNTSHFTRRRLYKYLALYGVLVVVSLTAAVLVYSLLSKELAFGIALFVAWIHATHAYFYEGCRRPRCYKALLIRFFQEIAMREHGICPQHGRTHLERRSRDIYVDLPQAGAESAPYCTLCQDFVTAQRSYAELAQIGSNQGFPG